MPSVAPLAEFNRNQSEMIAELAETGEPIYLTRNGRAYVVVMDAEAFDRAQSFREELRERELETLSQLLEGYRDKQEGRTLTLADADARIRSQKGWA